MTSLRKLQDDFLDYLLAPGEQMHGKVLGSPAVSAEQRLKIYADGYRSRLRDALIENHPALFALLGEDEFERMAYAYVDATPSKHFSIRYFGHALGDFLAWREPYNKHPVLADMARFEWTLRDVFDATDAPPLTVGDLATVSPDAWPELRLQPHPTVRRLELNWNISEIWKAIDAEQDPPDPTQSAYPISWIVWRHDLKTLFRSVTVDEAWAIDAVRAKAPFSELCAGLCEWVDERHAAQHAAQLVHRWIVDGVLGKTLKA